MPVPNLQTIDYTNLYSESSALLFAYNSGIIADILGGEAVFTVNGRMSSGSFSYWVRNNPPARRESSTWTWSTPRWRSTPDMKAGTR